MLETFFTYDEEWGSYNPTTAGYVALSLLLVLILLVCVLISSRSEKKLKTREMAFCSISLALAFVSGTFLKIFQMPMGGAVTLCSMLFISLIGYWYGLRVGLMTAFAYGMLSFIADPFIIGIPQVFFDYIFAFGSLGLSGLFRNKKHGLILGYITGVIGRFIFSFLSGIMFFQESIIEGGAKYGISATVYSIAYNGSYIGAEALFTIIVILLPPVAKGLRQTKQLATKS